MDKNMKEIEKKIENTDKDCGLELMEVLIKVSLQMTDKKDLDNLYIQMD